MIIRYLSGALILAALPAVAFASGGIAVPEASSALLFAIGAAGVLLGRTASMRRRRHKDEKDKS